MISIYVHQNGETTTAPRVDPAWLEPTSDVTLWVDLSAPGQEENHPKIEPYQNYLYLILHGIDFDRREQEFATRDVDFFLGRNSRVTVHDGRSRSIAKWREICDHHDHVLAEGPAALLHRIVDTMVASYRPETEALEEQIDELEEEAILGRQPDLIRNILGVKRDLASLRRVVIPQRDAVGRLARREFPQINDRWNRWI